VATCTSGGPKFTSSLFTSALARAICTANAVTPDATEAIDVNGTALTAVTKTYGITTANYLLKDTLDVSAKITPVPGDFVNLKIFRDVSGDDAAVDVDVVAFRVHWKRG